jgi:hypothetical protein
MCSRHATLLALSLAVLASTSTAAAPVLRYSWDNCDPLIPRRDFAAPALYSQTISALGLEGPVEHFTLLIGLKTYGYHPMSYPAWQFQDLWPSCFECCQPTGRVSTLLEGTTCDTIPGLHVSAIYRLNPAPPLAWLWIEGVATGSFTPDPTRRYTLARIAFDHSGSGVGFGAPAGTCGAAEMPLLFEIGEFELNGVDQRPLATWENCLLTWNWSWSAANCPLVVPVRNRTWGQIKTLYR